MFSGGCFIGFGGISLAVSFPFVATPPMIDRARMKHLALPVRDQERSRRFYEAYFGFDAEPARRYDDGVLMLYDAQGFSLGGLFAA